MIENEIFLILTYFDMRIGPNILYSNMDPSTVDNFPDITKVLEFNTEEGTFLFSYRRFQTANYIFYLKDDLARGGVSQLMISCVLRSSFFQNEFVDVIKYLEKKGKILEKFATKIKDIKDFNKILHYYKRDPKIEQFVDFCEANNIDFITLYDKYYKVLFPESEVKIINKHLYVEKKIYLLASTYSVADQYLKNLEIVYFTTKEKFDIPSRIMSIVIDNVIIKDLQELDLKNFDYSQVQAFILIIDFDDEHLLQKIKKLLNNLRTYDSIHQSIPVALILSQVPCEKARQDLKQILSEESKLNEHLLKLYQFNAFVEDPILLNPLKWIIKNLF